MSTGAHLWAFGALAWLAASALTSPALADEAAQESGAVSLSADTSAPASSTEASSSPAAPAAAPAAAPRGGIGDLRIFAGLHFGFGGELNAKVDGGALVTRTSLDLDPTVGLHAGVDYVLLKYFALGGEIRLSWWKPDSNIAALQDAPGRSLYFDLDIKPRGRYMFENIGLEVYGTLPLGLSVASINDDLPMDGGAGFNLGFGGGATYFITSRIGVNMELLGVWHWFDGELYLLNADTDNRTAQFYWVLSGVFAI